MSDGLKNVRQRYDDPLSRLDGERLRALMAEYYRRQGYRVDAVEAGMSGAAGEQAGPEFDLRLHRDDSRLLVRCFHWADKQVPHQRVRGWLDLPAHVEADGSIIATSGEFTPSAIRTASLSKTLRLVDGDELRKMLLPLIDEGFDAGAGADEIDAFADMGSFVEDSFLEDSSMRPASPTAGAHAHVDAADADGPDDEIVSFSAADGDAADAFADKPTDAKPRRIGLWERGSRPASNMSIAVAGVLLTLIVLTIVFRHRLDPYLGDAPRQAASPPRDESPLAGTDYKSDVFDPEIHAQQEPTGPKPKPQRPEPPRTDTNQPSPDQAIKVIERTTPEMNESTPRKAPPEQ